MSTPIGDNQRFTIKEASKLSGLPESTLRYYESIELINPIGRDPSSKHRVYSQSDINLIIAMACLNATGLSIEDMRTYFRNRGKGAAGAREQIELLTAQKDRLVVEERYMKLRREYVEAKIAYWHAVVMGNKEKLKAITARVRKITEKMKLPKEV